MKKIEINYLDLPCSCLHNRNGLRMTILIHKKLRLLGMPKAHKRQQIFTVKYEKV